jgi:hypothetical protein
MVRRFVWREKRELGGDPVALLAFKEWETAEETSESWW